MRRLGVRGLGRCWGGTVGVSIAVGNTEGFERRVDIRGWRVV